LKYYIVVLANMIFIKTFNEIQIMKEGGKILSEILRKIVKMVNPGVSTGELERMACGLIKEAGGKPAFLGYCPEESAVPFPTALCISINSEIVHAPSLPSRILKDGDVVSFDIGLQYKGLFTDMATTVGVGKMDKKDKKLINVTRDALKLMIKNIKAGVVLADLGYKVEKFVNKKGFAVVKNLVGHGVGRQIHEPPEVPNFYDPTNNVVLKEGMTLALEPMVMMHECQIFEAKDGWTIKTADNCKAAHFEATVVVTKKGRDIVTPLV
jgi:methionyl aminopeptidase